MSASAPSGLCKAMALAVLAPLVLAAVPATTTAAPGSSPGALKQLRGKAGCVGAPTARRAGCATARALKGPGPFMGSRAIAVSPDGRNVYVASSTSDAIAIFKRDTQSGTLVQPKGKGGCIASLGGGKCATAVGLTAPNSIAISRDGRNLYATARDSNTVTTFARNRKSGALHQLPGGCISGLALPGCTVGQALVAPDVIVASSDGKNVYAGAFFGNAIASFARDPSTGALSQLSGTAACIAESNAACEPGIALGSPEGLAIGDNGGNLYVASALSNAITTLARDPSTGALSQSACIVQGALQGCASGVQLGGANAVALSPGNRDAYVTNLLSNSVTSFTRSSAGALAQKPYTTGCLVFLRAVGCSFARAMSQPEGIAVAPDGRNVYVAAFGTGAIDVLNRNRATGRVAQKPGLAGCLGRSSGCTPARATRGASSIAISPDGRFVYATSFYSNAVDVFRRKG
jgi:DNA-binding beta-propeller fold protein YncE